MALKTCPHCGHSVSDKATKCPQCGKDPRFTDFQLEQQEQQRKKKRKKKYHRFRIGTGGCFGRVLPCLYPSIY